jgi:hypothetical protein
MMQEQPAFTALPPDGLAALQENGLLLFVRPVRQGSHDQPVQAPGLAIGDQPGQNPSLSATRAP